MTGATITPGIETPTAVVLATDVGGNTGNDSCNGAASRPGRLTGKIVVCERGNRPAARIRAFNVLQGGAAGMILAQRRAAIDLFTDNSLDSDDPCSTRHGPACTGTLLAFLAANTGETATCATGARRRSWFPDVMTAFSSRGPVSGLR